MGMSNEYQRAHRSVIAARGRAQEHPCIQCGGPAFHWAYQHNDSEAQRDAYGLLYSVKPDCYEPMCRPCHHLFDIAHETPEEREARRGHMRWVQTQRRGYQSEAHREAARANAVKARASINRDDAYLEKMREAGRKAASVRRTCTCGKESTRAGIGTHQKVTGHVGYVGE